MIIVMASKASPEQIAAVTAKIRAAGLAEHVSCGTERTIIGAIGDERALTPDMFELMPGVERAMRVMKEYRIVSREAQPTDTVVRVRGVPIGGETVQIIAGPCSVETPEQMALSAAAVADAGCRLMRGGAFKPRSSPYSFQGLGVEGLDYLQQAARQHGLPVVTELMDVRMLDTFLEHDVDVIQIGARNMQNFDLLKEVGRINKPVILKRGLAATISEWLMAAEYIAAGGNHNIIFCERGVRSFETAYRNMLDVTAIPVLKKESHLPVIVTPVTPGARPGWFRRWPRPPWRLAPYGLMVEMHPNPCEAWCDADQALTPAELKALVGELRPLAQALGRNL